MNRLLAAVLLGWFNREVEFSRERDSGLAGELIREGDYWTIVFGGRELRVRDSKGMGYIAELLARPGVPIAALELARGRSAAGVGAVQAEQAGLDSSGESDTGPVLDADAKAAYRQRLEELRAEQDQAEAFNDPERAERAREEYEFVAGELAAAVGLRGRDRRSGSPAERARVNVTRSIKATLEHLSQHDRALAEHLAATVSTGRMCSYRSEPGERVDWQVLTRQSRPGLPRRFEPPDTHYTRSGEVSIAYQVLGEGPIDLVLVPGWVSHLDFQWTDPTWTSFMRSLASYSRLIMFDKRGVGLSDPVGAAPTLEERMDDVRAVMDAVGSQRAVLFGLSEGAPIAILFAATYPERTLGLVLYGSYPAGPAADDAPGRAELNRAVAVVRAAADAWGEGASLDLFAPDLARNPVTRRFWGMFERASMSPALAHALIDWVSELDVRAALPAVSSPTLVLHRTGDHIPIAAGRFIAERISGALFTELPGDAHLPITGDMEAITDAVEQFVTTLTYEPEPARVLATILVIEAPANGASTHLAVVRDQLARAGGVTIADAAGRLTARFDRPARAIRCARDALQSAGAQGTGLRAGLHAGECELNDAALSGIAVAIATQVAARAQPGDVLTSGTVRDLVLGSGIEFDARGVHELPGAGGDWTIYAVTEIHGAPRLSATGDEHIRVLDRAGRGVARHAPGVGRATMRVVRGGK